MNNWKAELKKITIENKETRKHKFVNEVHPSWATSLGFLPMSDHSIKMQNAYYINLVSNLQPNLSLGLLQ
jgi:hypothetical protein